MTRPVTFLFHFLMGGAITATEALTIVFSADGELTLGTAGSVNSSSAPSNLDYSGGGVLSLAKGESITFGDGGYLSVASAGNLDYTDISIDTNGVILVGGNATIDRSYIPSSNIGDSALFLDGIVYQGSPYSLDVDFPDVTLRNITVQGVNYSYVFGSLIVLDGVIDYIESASSLSSDVVSEFYVLQENLVSTANGYLGVDFIIDTKTFGSDFFFIRYESSVYKNHCWFSSADGSITFLSGLTTIEEIKQSCDKIDLSGALRVGDYGLESSEDFSLIVTDINDLNIDVGSLDLLTLCILSLCVPLMIKLRAKQKPPRSSRYISRLSLR